MKLKPNQSLTQPLISEIVDYYAELEAQNTAQKAVFHSPLKRPNPPTPEAVAKAQFIDKTYQWKGSAAAKAADVQPSV